MLQPLLGSGKDDDSAPHGAGSGCSFQLKRRDESVKQIVRAAEADSA